MGERGEGEGTGGRKALISSSMSVYHQFCKRNYAMMRDIDEEREG